MGKSTLQEWFDYFASCHAATIWHEAMLSRCSKSSRERLVSIGRSMLPIVESEDVKRRLQEAIEAAEKRRG